MSDDATADFLAREREALGDDADFFGGPPAAPSFPAGLGSFPALDGADDLPSPAAAAPSAPAGIDAFPDIMGDVPTTSEVRVTGHAGTEDAERDAFEQSFPDIGGDVPAVAAVPPPVFNPVPYGESPYPAPKPRSAASVLPPPTFSNILPQDDEETEPIKQWRAKQAEEIKARDDRDKERREETVAKAEKAIDKFYEDYNAKKAANIKENKEKEAAFLEKLSESVAKGTSWERITDLLELQNSQSKTIRPSIPGGSDLARMKEILLALRREGDKAPSAAGY